MSQRPIRRPGGRRLRLPLLISLGALTITAAACGSDGETQTASADELRLAIGTEPRTLDVLTAEDGQTTLFQFNVYETLAFREGPDMELTPKLAESWEVNDKTWTFVLRQGVKFHDGSDFTSEDVVASFDRLMQPTSEIAGSRAGGITDVVAVDDYTVDIVSEAPDPTIPAKVSLIPMVAAELAAIDSDEIASTMNGTGPYKFVEWQRGDEIDLEAASDDEYWGDAAEIDKVALRFLEEDSTRVSSLRAGEIDAALNIPAEFEDSAPKLATGPSPDVFTVFFNTENGGAFEDVRVRQAAALAIDRQSLVDNLLGGHGEGVKGQFVGQYVFGSSPALEEVPFDQDQARTLLDEAGGASITLTSPTGRWPKDREMTQAIAGMLEEVGFEVEVTLPELGAWLESLFAEGQDTPDAWVAGHGNDIFDMERSVSWITCDGELSHYCNEEVTDLVTAARNELDPETRQALYEEMWALAQQDFPWASITTIEQLHATADNIEWQPRSDGFVLFTDVSIA